MTFRGPVAPDDQDHAVTRLRIGYRASGPPSASGDLDGLCPWIQGLIKTVAAEGWSAADVEPETSAAGRFQSFLQVQ